MVLLQLQVLRSCFVSLTCLFAAYYNKHIKRAKGKSHNMCDSKGEKVYEKVFLSFEQL